MQSPKYNSTQEMMMTNQLIYAQSDYLELSEHAAQRMCQRGLHEWQIELVLKYGREIHSRRAVFHVVGRKEIQKYGSKVPELKKLDGIQVVTGGDNLAILTVYRNHDLRGIRPNKRRHRHLH